MNKIFKKIILLSCFVLMSLHSMLHAQNLDYFVSDSAYTQNFDSLPFTGTFSLTGKNVFYFNKSPFNKANLAGWQFYQIVGTSVKSDFNILIANSSAHGVYSLGTINSKDRALGSLATTSGTYSFGLVINNKTGKTLNSFNIRFFAEQWRRGGSGNINTWAFKYKIGNYDSINILNFISDTNGNFSSVNYTNSDSYVIMGGDSIQNKKYINFTNSNFVWENNQQLILRWDDRVEAGSNDAMGIDDFSFVATKLPPKYFSINTSTSIGGNITPSTQVIQDTNYTINFSSISGYKIDSIKVNNVKISIDSSYTIYNINSNYFIQLFTTKLNFITINSISNNGFIQPQSVEYTELGYTASFNPNPGFKIDSVLISNIKVNIDSIVIIQTLNTIKDLQVFTSPILLSVNTFSTEGGIITPSTFIKYDASFSVKLNTYNGYKIDSIIINGNKVNNDTIIQLNNIHSNYTINLFTSKLTYYVSTYINLGGTITPSSSVFYDSNFTIQYNLDSLYKLDSIFINNLYDSIATINLNNSYRFLNIKENKSIRIVCKQKTPCVYSFSNPNNTHSSKATIGSFDLLSKGDLICNQWQATTNDNWIIIYSDSVGVGANQINYAILENNANLNRIGYINVAGLSFTVNQSAATPCTYALSNTRVVHNADDTAGSFNLLSSSFQNCSSWEITTNADWIKIYSAKNGTGFNNIKYVINKNYGDSRTGNIYVAGLNFTILQNGIQCLSNLTPTIFNNNNILSSNINEFSIPPINYSNKIWYFNYNLIDSTKNNTFTPTNAGVYTVKGFDDVHNCSTNISKKYYFSQNCIIPEGRLGNAASIEGNIVNDPTLILITWCSQIFTGNIIIQGLDIQGNKVFEQKQSASTGLAKIFKTNIIGDSFYIQILDENREIIQISDLITK